MTSNCLTGISQQRTSSDCSSFCGANSASGPCGGHGTCAFDAKKKPACTCEAGRSPPDCQSKVNSPPPSPPPPTSPSPSTESWRDTWLTIERRPMKHRNPYFRYASYRFVGTNDKPNWDLKASIDWSDSNVAPIEDQRTCNAYWAMAPAASVESLLSISKFGPLRLSKQQILDCQGRNETCGGGWPTDAFEFMATNGLVAMADYPWVNGNQVCDTMADSDNENVKIAMYEEVDFYGSFGLLLAVQNQSVVVNIQSSSEGFQNYTSGIMDREDCFTNVVDHTVVIVGYNLFRGSKPYWIIRNSWGTGWGENGYMRLAYTGGLGICGIHSTSAYYPVLPLSVTSYFSNSKNPCGSPNPCGKGECSIDPLTKLNKCKSCPPSFIRVTNLDKTQPCVPLRVCQQKSVNPCGIGTCVDDMSGGYSCICPRGYNQTTFSDTDQFTCIEASSIKDLLFYTVQAGDTCNLISLSFGLSKQQFQKQNGKIDCENLVTGLTKVNVTQSPNWAGCAVKYSWNKGESCLRITSLLKISLKDLTQTLNPGLDCNQVVPGSQICVKSGTPP